jgi:hypothetical protein
MLKRTNDLTLDCYIDADFACLWNYKDDQDPPCFTSRSGYIMTLGKCPVHWTSKLQTEIALSTTEAEYISLVQAFQEFIPMHCAYEELLATFDLTKNCPITVKSTIFGCNFHSMHTKDDTLH